MSEATVITQTPAPGARPGRWRWPLTAGLLVALALAGGWLALRQQDPAPWTAEELRLLEGLRLARFELQADPSNAVADLPMAAEFGRRLFFDARLSGNGRVSCATCHQPQRYFSDGLPVSVGTARTTRNAMTVVGAAASPWYFWDGRKDSLWAQATGPLESAAEQNTNRGRIAHIVAADPAYSNWYEKLFGALPELADGQRFPADAGPLGPPAVAAAWRAMRPEDQTAVTRVMINVTKSIAAYERLLLPGPDRLDAYLDEVLADAAAGSEAEAPAPAYLNAQERAGLRLFIGKAGCLNCHNGPLLTNNEFHNTGVISAPGQAPAKGRSLGVALVRADPFNCLGAFSDASPEDCVELRFARSGDTLIGAQRTPSLRGVARTAPYMHAGQIASLEEAVEHYDRAEPALVGHNEALPLDLSGRERAALVAFLKSLDGPMAAAPRWLAEP